MSLPEEIASVLRTEAASGKLGRKFPTVRVLMERFDATQFTVQKVLSLLREEGIIESHVGRGTFLRHGASTSAAAVEVAAPGKGKVLILTQVKGSGRGDVAASEVYHHLTEQGYDTVSVSYSEPETIISNLGQNAFDVCFLQPRQANLDISALVGLKRIARHLVVEGGNLERLDIDVVMRDRYETLKVAINALRDLGHDHIGLITQSSPVRAKYADLQRLFEFAGDVATDLQATTIAAELTIGNGSATASSITQAIERIPADRRPTGYLVSGEFSAVDIQQAFDTIGMRIPADASVIRLRLVDDPTDFFSSVARASEDTAVAAVELIKWRLANPSAPPRTIYDKPKVRMHKSTARRRDNTLSMGGTYERA